MANVIHFQFAVYFLRSPQKPADALTTVREVLKRYPDLRFVSEIPKTAGESFVYLRIEKDVRKKYPPPDMQSLAYFGRGISQKQGLALQDSQQAIIMDFGHGKEKVWTGLRAANRIVEEVARRSGGLVWDEETREIFSADKWHEKRLAAWAGEVPEVTTQTVIHSYDNGKSMRAITLGMKKIGLPDVVIEESAWSSEHQIGNLINIFGQLLAEGKHFNRSGDFKLALSDIHDSRFREEESKSLMANAKGIACLTLRNGTREEGDPQNRLVRLEFDKYPGDDEGARQEALISALFGWHESVAHIKNNQELLNVSAEAKAKLPELQRVFNRGLDPGEFIEVKAPFATTDGGTEWMWVEITSWKGDIISGLLRNDPEFVPNLHAGQRVEVRQQDVFDYIRNFADGKSEGNATGEIIRKMDEAPAENDTKTEIVVPDCNAD